MNEVLIEEEVNERVRFKMNEFYTSFKNHMKRHEIYGRAGYLGADKDESLKSIFKFEAYTEIKEILQKEIELPTALDGDFKERTWVEKEKLVNVISERLLKKGDYDYMRKKSFINNQVEKFIGCD